MISTLAKVCVGFWYVAALSLASSNFHHRIQQESEIDRYHRILGNMSLKASISLLLIGALLCARPNATNIKYMMYLTG